MTATALPHLRYDTHETLDRFQARQRRAYAAGTTAWRDGQITGQALQLYNELVRFVGANRFAWVKEETLALELRRSASTIKRWMQQLVDANLIRRERRFGATSLTYITAYNPESHVPLEPAADADALPAGGLPAVVLSVTRDDETSAPAAVALAVSTTGGTADPQPAGPFFGSMDAPTISSAVSRESFKHQHVKTGGDGTAIALDITSSAEEPRASMDRLAAEGVFDRDVLQELQGQPVEHIEQVIRYVARCRTRDDPRRPGLIVHLLRQGFAARPCGRHRPAADRRRSPGQGDQRGHASPPLRGSPLDELLAGSTSSDAQSPPSSPAGTASELDHIWQHILAQLAILVEAPAYDTWLAPSRLLLLDDGEAVVGVPNVFARDEITRTYAAQVEAVLHQLCGRPIALQVIIGSSLYRL